MARTRRVVGVVAGAAVTGALIATPTASPAAPDPTGSPVPAVVGAAGTTAHPQPRQAATDPAAYAVLGAADFRDGWEGWEPTTEGDPTLGWRLGKVRGKADAPVAAAPGPAPEDCPTGDPTGASDTAAVAGVAHLTGPTWTWPTDAGPARLRLNHSWHTREGADGGVVSLSVEGGDFAPVPADAWLDGAPAGRLASVGAPSRNPLVGNDAFTGLSQGVPVTGGALDLGAAGVSPGDDFRVRLSFGRDDCRRHLTRFDGGWAVESVSAVVGPEPLEVSARWRGLGGRGGVGFGRDVRAALGYVTALHRVETPRPGPSTRLVSDGARVTARRGPFALHFSTADLGLGWHRLAVRFVGGRRYAPADSDEHAVRVRRGRAHLSTRLRPQRLPVARRPFRLEVRTPQDTGRVRVLFRGREVGRARVRPVRNGRRGVRPGRASVRVSRPIPAGERWLTAIWSGSRGYHPAREVVRTRFVRRRGFVVPPPPATPDAREPFRVLWTEEFDDGLAGWALTDERDTWTGRSLAWEATTASYGEGPLTVARAPQPQGGSCAGDEADTTGMTTLTSPAFRFAADDRTARVELHHQTFWQAGGSGDGGQVQIRVGDGAFTTVPLSAWLSTERQSIAAAGSSPLAGQPVLAQSSFFGYSVLDLRRAGAVAGQDVRLRFRFALDGCGGRPPARWWAVDSVRVVTGQRRYRLDQGTTPVRLSYDLVRVERGRRVTVSPRLTSERDYSPDPEPTGTVRLIGTRGDSLDRIDVGDDDVLRLDTSRLPLGQHALYLVYEGDELYAPTVRRKPLRLVVGRPRR
jgi:hypothetical protein